MIAMISPKSVPSHVSPLHLAQWSFAASVVLFCCFEEGEKFFFGWNKEASKLGKCLPLSAGILWHIMWHGTLTAVTQHFFLSSLTSHGVHSFFLHPQGPAFSTISLSWAFCMWLCKGNSQLSLVIWWIRDRIKNSSGRHISSERCISRDLQHETGFLGWVMQNRKKWNIGKNETTKNDYLGAKCIYEKLKEKKKSYQSPAERRADWTKLTVIKNSKWPQAFQGRN